MPQSEAEYEAMIELTNLDERIWCVPLPKPATAKN